MENVDKIYELLESIKVSDDNREIIQNIKDDITNERYMEALAKMRKLKEDGEEAKEEKVVIKKVDENKEENGKYPYQISNQDLEKKYIGMLLNNPKLIMKYYFLFDECFFEDAEMLNLYKSVLFNEGSKYASEKAKERFNFSKENELTYSLKNKLIKLVIEKNYDIEKIYTDLKKLFILRKAYIETPENNLQQKIIEITDYELYDRMSAKEIEDTINQIIVTRKFKQSILSDNLVDFLESEENELSNGLKYPFPILTKVFKGIRKGETFCFAMPSNSGKSRLTVDIAAYTALIHKKKVLIISNEMSEEKMKLCLITTIINNPDIQKLYGEEIHVSAENY